MKNVQITQELFLALVKYHLLETTEEEEKRIDGQGGRNGKKANLQPVQDSTYRRRTGKSQTGISG